MAKKQQVKKCAVAHQESQPPLPAAPLNGRAWKVHGQLQLKQGAMSHQEFQPPPPAGPSEWNRVGDGPCLTGNSHRDVKKPAPQPNNTNMGTNDQPSRISSHIKNSSRLKKNTENIHITRPLHTYHLDHKPGDTNTHTYRPQLAHTSDQDTHAPDRPQLAH